MALQYLQEKLINGARALDVGSGSGYLTACFAKMVSSFVVCIQIQIGPAGKAVGIEHIQGLVDLSLANVRKTNADLLESGTLTFVRGDGRLGYAKDAPYNAIHVGAAADNVPQEVIIQFKADSSALFLMQIN